MSAPAPLPTAVAPIASSNPNALVGMLGRLKEYGAGVFKQQKPWGEVFDKSAFSKPGNTSEAISRIRKNAAYFRVNYLIVVLGTTVATMVTHPSSLFWMGALLASWVYALFIRTSPIVISGRQLSEREKLLGLSAISFIVIFFLTSVGTLLFSALASAFVLVCAHGACREPDNLFVDEGENQQSFLSIITGAPAQTGSNNV